MVSKINFHVGYSIKNGCWFVRFYPYHTQQQAKDAAEAFTHYTREQALEEAETQGNLKQWNIQDHLKTPGSIAEYLQATLDEGDSELLINAVSDAIRALKSQPVQTGGGK